MLKFIKFTNVIINTKHIQSIVINPNKYIIQLVSNKFDGSIFSIVGSGCGNITSYNTEMEVCKNKHPADYKILTDWINNSGHFFSNM